MGRAEYWRGRFSILEQAAQNKADESIDQLEGMFLDASRTVQQELERWYGRFAENNAISLTQARKLLTAGELEEFKWAVEQYIEAASNGNTSAEWLKKLENASARFHVSRLESVQVGIQQQIELLYGNHLDELDGHIRRVAADSYGYTAYEIQKGLGYGWDITAMSQKKLDTLLAKPWTTDGRTFSDRCWLNKAELVSTVNRELTQGLLRGDSAMQISGRIQQKFGVAKSKAQRLVRTETTYFNGVATLESYRELGVEQVEILETLDGKTCEICGPLDGTVLPLSQCEPGVTIPPFHPRCRGTTCPHYDDMEGVRAARDEDGNYYEVPSDMSYERWKEQQDAVYGAGTVDLRRKINYNANTDREQFKAYKERLGKNAPATLAEYRKIRYSEDWSLFKAYAKSIQSGELSALADFKLYKNKSTEIDRVLVGVTTKNGLTVTGKSYHYIARTIGSISQRRSGVDVPEALDTITNSVKIESVRTATNGRSQRFVGENSAVTINPDTGILIQVNPI